MRRRRREEKALDVKEAKDFQNTSDIYACFSVSLPLEPVI